jgi:hypothetical protein
MPRNFVHLVCFSKSAIRYSFDINFFGEIETNFR